MAALFSVRLTSSGVSIRFFQPGKSTHNHFCHTPRALSLQAVDVTSAPEKYQQVIRDVLRGCEGVANIADDLVVHGKGVEEHDRHLFAVLDRLSEAGLIVNGDKCEFSLTKLKFFGHELSSDGVSPSEEKIAAIRDARSAKDASKVRSFMGLVQYSTKFMPDLARFDQKRSFVCMGCRTAESVSRTEALDHPGRNTGLLSSWLQNQDCR